MFAKCGHEHCRCIVDGDEFCSDYCEERAGTAEVEAIADQKCQCDHAACAG